MTYEDADRAREWIVSPASAYFLVGPTAVGKSAVAQHIAEKGPLDILSADSMVVYRGMDVGTAKPSTADRERVRYFGVDLVEPDDAFNAWLYLEEAREAVKTIAERERSALVTGGSGLYVKALTHGLDEALEADSRVRCKWELVLETEGLSTLQDALKSMSPRLYKDIDDKQNVHRVLRALEMAEAGVVQAPVGWGRKGHGVPLAGLRRDFADLKQRIAARASRMFEEGLVDEVEELMRRFPDFSRTAGKAIGYAEAMAVLRGALKRENAVDRVVKRTWQLARRQMTWFRHQARVTWIDVDETTDVSEIGERVIEHWTRHGPTAVAV